MQIVFDLIAYEENIIFIEYGVTQFYLRSFYAYYL